jgi:Rad3-related DNA helicase
MELDEYELLPSKFQKWAKYQKKVVEKIVNSDKKYFVLRAPTGSGKSLMGIVAGLETGKTYYCVHNIQLQQQIIDDFPFVHQVKGRANFKCKSSMLGETCDPGVFCGSGRGKKCSNASVCDYKIQKAIAQESDFVVFNYAYYLAIINSQYGGFNDPDLIIMDEAHIADGALSGYVNFDISRRVLDINHLRFPDKGEDVFQWLEYLRDITSDKIKSFKEMANNVNDSKRMAINHDIKRLTTINNKASFLLENLDDDWIINMFSDKYTDRIVFVPVWVDKFSHLLLGHADKYLLMSATISELDMKLLGIKESEMQFLDMPSTFLPSNMPVVYYGYEKINRYTDRKKLVTVIDGLIKRHPDTKGVLHTVSYSLAKDILEHSRYSDRMIANSAEELYTDALILERRNESIASFLESSDPSILVSPSVETGLDLKDDLGRWQIICKVPFASLGDEVVIRRKEDHPIWYTADAINRIVQGSGRVCRSISDHGTTYIIDKNLAWLVKRHKDLFPPWWMDAVRAGNKIK